MTSPCRGVVVEGELDLLAAPRLEALFDGLPDDRADFDLSGVTFFDSSALRVFLAARRRRPRLRIVNPSRAVTKVLDITGTTDYLLHGREIAW
jgi:anti-anti-sigma factor